MTLGIDWDADLQAVINDLPQEVVWQGQTLNVVCDPVEAGTMVESIAGVYEDVSFRVVMRKTGLLSAPARGQLVELTTPIAGTYRIVRVGDDEAGAAGAYVLDLQERSA